MYRRGRENLRRDTLARVVIAAFMLSMSALAAPMLASGASDSSPPAELGARSQA